MKSKKLGIVIPAVAGSGLPLSALAHAADNDLSCGGYGYGMMGGYYGNMMGYNGFSGFIFGWTIILLILLLIGVASYYIFSRKKKNSTNDSTLEILKERYAKGEINKDKFEEMKKDLKIK